MNFADYGLQAPEQMMVQQNYNGVTPMDTFFPPQDAFVRQPVSVSSTFYHLIEAELKIAVKLSSLFSTHTR